MFCTSDITTCIVHCVFSFAQVCTKSSHTVSAHDAMSKGAKSHTYHTNLFITYYYDVLDPIFVCGIKTEGLKSAWERNQKKARKCKRTQSEDDGANLTKSSCILTLWDGAGTEVYIVVDEHRKEKKKLVLWCSWIVYWIVPKQPSSLDFDVIWHQTVHVTCYTCCHIACKQTNT